MLFMKSKDYYELKLDELFRPYLLVKNLDVEDNLRNMKLLMKFLNNPDKSFEQIHVAGTSGKTSTCYYLASLLNNNNNLKIGLAVSPYVNEISERFQINFNKLDQKNVYLWFKRYIKIISKFSEKLTYFDLIYSFSIWYFNKQKVDYAVIETGIGGRLDPTNVLDSPNKVCVITDIGYDHQEILGKTLPEIAYQKVGIVKRNNILITYSKSPNIMRVLKNWTKEVNAKINIFDQKDKDARLNNIIEYNQLADYQQKNFNLALRTYEYISKRDHLKKLDNNNLLESLSINIPGRMEIEHLKDNSILILDGAHNTQKIKTFLNSLNSKYPGYVPVILIAISHKKNYQKILDQIIKTKAFIILTKFKSNDSMPIRAIEPINLEKYLNKVGYRDYLKSDNLNKALKIFLNKDNHLKVVTGSFYLISEVKKKLNLSS